LVDEKTAIKILGYNHHLMKGDLDKKREALVAIGRQVEPTFPKLKKYNPDLESDIGFLLNQLNIRHNNLEGMRKSEYLEKLNDKELEEWYDHTYDVLLYAILTLNYMNLKQEIKELKTKIN